MRLVRFLPSRAFVLASLLLAVCVASVFAALDSATVVNGVGTAGQIAQAIAQAQGQAATANIISIVTVAVCSVLSFFFGHRHGKASK